jgi:hypothetical protein
LTGKEGRKGTERTPDPGKEKPRRANHTGQRGRLAYLSAVTGESGEDHKGDEKSAKEKISQSTEEVGHRNSLPSTTSKRRPRGPSLLSIIGRYLSAQSAQNTFTDT